MPQPGSQFLKRAPQTLVLLVRVFNRPSRTSAQSIARTILALTPSVTGIRTPFAWRAIAPIHLVLPFPIGLSISPCHQPDLANLHGSHLSPANFYRYPQSCAYLQPEQSARYVDIRYPSPWNYVHNTAYAPTNELSYSRFAEKDNTLFWCGAVNRKSVHRL